MVERRHEQRAQPDLAVQVSGRDTNGTPFAQRATASNISSGGALLSGAPAEYDLATCVGGIPTAKSSTSELCG